MIYYDNIYNMARPTIAVYFDEDYFDNDGNLTFIDAYYKDAYKNLIKAVIEHDVDVIIATNAKDTYMPDSQFKSYWQAEYAGGSLLLHKVDDHPRQFALLFDKGKFPFTITNKINNDRIAKIAQDKYLSYLFAPDFHAQSFLLVNQSQLDIFCKTQQDDNIVIKELLGHGGKQVYVGPAKDYNQTLNFPLLGQRFIDTSGGFPELASEHHDIRVVLFDGQPIHGLVREAAPNKLKSNFAEGGSVRGLFTSEIPRSLIEMAQELDRRFAIDVPRLFSADWGFDKDLQSWKLFEINSAPGLALASVDGPAADEFTNLLAKHLARSAHAITN